MESLEIWREGPRIAQEWIVWLSGTYRIYHMHYPCRLYFILNTIPYNAKGKLFSFLNLTHSAFSEKHHRRSFYLPISKRYISMERTDLRFLQGAAFMPQSSARLISLRTGSQLASPTTLIRSWNWFRNRPDKYCTFLSSASVKSWSSVSAWIVERIVALFETEKVLLEIFPRLSQAYWMYCSNKRSPKRGSRPDFVEILRSDGERDERKWLGGGGQLVHFKA